MNRRYEAKFGHVFIICASGKSAQNMLATLKERQATGMHAMQGLECYTPSHIHALFIMMEFHIIMISLPVEKRLFSFTLR